MNNIIEKYEKRLAVLKENRSQAVESNSDSENELYDTLIKQVAEFVRDMKASRDSRQLSAVPSEEYLVSESWEWEELTTFFSDEELFKIRYDGETEYKAVITIKRGIAG